MRLKQVVFSFIIPIFIAIGAYSQSMPYAHLFYNEPINKSTKDSLLLISKSKIFYDFFGKSHLRTLSPNINDTLVITTAVCVSKKNRMGYFSTFISPDSLIEIVELKRGLAHGYHYEYDLLRIGYLNFKIHYKNGKMHGDYFQYGIRKGKMVIVAHHKYKNGKRTKIMNDN